MDNSEVPILVDDNEPNDKDGDGVNVDDNQKFKKKKTSVVWDHFTTIPKKEGEINYKPKASCNYCGQVYAADSNLVGTSSMRTHFQKLCREYENSEYNLKRKGDKRQKTLAFDACNKLTSWSFSVDASRKALAEMILIDELPFSFVDGQGFRKFMRVVQPKWENIPCRITIAKDCIQLYKDTKKGLKKALKDQRICLTTDTWTSLQNLNYMCLTAHFIDCDWKLHKRILNFCLVPNHKGETLGKQVENCLVEWGIDKILTLTIDNASSNNGIVDYLKKKTSKSDSTILHHDFLHVRCCAHILNLIVREGLKDVHVSIARVRNIVKYVRSSPSRYRKFRACVDRDKIKSKLVPCLDVATRWNSTFFMLERALIYQKAFERLEDEDGILLNVGVREDEVDVAHEVENDDEFELVEDREMWEREIMIPETGRGKRRGKNVSYGTPNSDDWKVVDLYVEVLRVFFVVTERFSGSLYVTSNTFFKEVMTIKKAITTLEKSDDLKLVMLAKGMNKKYDKYWGTFDKINQLLLYANVLDPRWKFVFVRWCLSKHYDKTVVDHKILEMKEGMTRLYNWYEMRSIQYAEQHNVGESRDMEKNAKGSFNYCDEMESDFESFMQAETNMVAKSELERYWSESNESNEKKDEDGKPEFNVLGWWKDKCSKYPILSQMAMDILAIPVSTVASESAFSTGGRILDPYRTSLSPKVAEALICAQNWLKNPTQISLREMLDEVERIDSEIGPSLQEDSCITDL